MTTTFADHLRSLDDEALATLLRLRPDLAVPVPADLAALAVRAQSRTSVARALDELDEFTLKILDAARLTRDDDGKTRVAAIVELAGTGPQTVAQPAIRAAIDRLRALHLLYGPPSALRVVAGVDEVCPPYPAGLGRPAAQLDPRSAALVADPARLRRTLLSTPPAGRAVLDRLAAGPPVGTLPPGLLDTPESVDAPPQAGAVSELAPAGPTGSPVPWLVANGLLVPIPDAPGNSGAAVELPREIGLLLRRDSGPLGPLRAGPPAVTGQVRERKSVDSAGAGQVMETLRVTEALLEQLAAEPAPVLRSGGIGVRDLRRLARATGLDEATTALLLEVAYAAGLLGAVDLSGATTTRGGADQQILPTGGYDTWRTSPLAARWELLVRNWLAMTRHVTLVGQRDDRDRLIAPLSVEVERAGAPRARRVALRALAGLAPGTAPDIDELVDLLTWHAPRRSRGHEAAWRAALAEAATLGVTGLGALTSYGRLLLDATESSTEPPDDPLGLRADPEAAPGPATARVLAGLLPTPVDHFLLQADLTVVVPGPPEPELAAELEIVAQPESAGGAAVHRITATSLRCALDAGYLPEDLHALFARRSRTPVPQSLTYLINDVGRRHGGLRVGAAGAYLRSEDAALLAEVLADRRLAPLALRRLAPTVLITPHLVGRLLDALRDAGYAPIAEDASGVVMLTRRRVRRAPARVPVTHRAADPTLTPALTEPRLLGILEQIRRGEAAARAVRRTPDSVRAANGRAGRGSLPAQAHGQTLAVLQQAIRDRALVWIGYVDAHGSTASRLLRPVSIGAGYLRAEDERTEMLHTFALHRITAAVPQE